MPQPLPPELVRLLFKTLLNDAQQSSRTFTNALAVCSLWYDLGIGMRWKDIVLDNFKLFRLHAFMPKHPSSKCYDRVRSLTICLTGFNTLALQGDLQNLAQCLSRTRYLTALSLELRYPRDESLQERCQHLGWGPWDLMRVLSSMPEGIRDLELVVSSHRLRHRPPTCTHCWMLASAVARIKNLRYHGALCPSFFVRLERLPPSQIEALAINMISSLSCNLTNCCCKLQSWRGLDSGAALVVAARSAIASGKLSNIKCFNILSMLGDSQLQDESRQELAIVCRNMVDNRTAIYPFIVGRPYCWIRYQESPNHIILEKVAKINDLAAQLEGRSRDVTTFGSRHPASYRRSIEGASAEYTWLPTADIKKIDVKCVKWEPAPALWRWEQEAGRKLLLPRFKDHVGEMVPLQRDICEAERRGERLSDCVMVIEYPDLPGADNTDDSGLTGESVGNSSELQ